MYLCVLPALLFRVCCEIALFATAIMVLPRHRAAGLLLLAVASMSMLITCAAPIVEVAGFSSMSRAQAAGFDVFLVGGWWLLALLGPTSQGINLLLLCVAVTLLARELPDAREVPDADPF